MSMHAILRRAPVLSGSVIGVVSVGIMVETAGSRAEQPCAPRPCAGSWRRVAPRPRPSRCHRPGRRRSTRTGPGRPAGNSGLASTEPRVRRDRPARTPTVRAAGGRRRLSPILRRRRKPWWRRRRDDRGRSSRPSRGRSERAPRHLRSRSASSNVMEYGMSDR